MKSLIQQGPRQARMVQMVVVSGMLLAAKGLVAQQNTTAPKLTPEDSAVCAALVAYPASHPDEMKQMRDRATQWMQSPETQKAVGQVMQAAMQRARNGKSGQSSVSSEVGQLNFTALPDTTRRAVAQAVGAGQFDSAKKLLLPTLGNDSTATLGLNLAFGMLALVPDSLRSLFSRTFERGGPESCGSLDSMNSAVWAPSPPEAKPLPPPVIRSDSASPNHP